MLSKFNIFSSSARVRAHTEEYLSRYSHPSIAFFLLIASASIMATCGLLLNNISIIIGAMVVAPIITPIFGLSLYLLITDGKGILRSLFLLSLGILEAIVSATLLVLLFQFFQEGTQIFITQEMITRTEPNMLFFIVSLCSGIAGAYAYSKPDLLTSVAGIAISVALIPPLSVAGITLAIGQWHFFEASMYFFLLNLLGIFVGSIVTFLALGFRKLNQ